MRHRGHLLAKRIARAPTPRRHHTVPRQDFLVVVKDQRVAQRESPG